MSCDMCRDREAMLSMFEGRSQVAESAEVGLERMMSENWTFVEDSDEVHIQ